MTELRVVATAGHVDHGKSSLIVRLTGMDPDRWEEEKRRGLTIDLGYAWCELPSGREVGFVDVPGHERFVANMLAGVGPVRLVLFVVAANEGWRPQSEEHLAILDVLGVAGGVVALTKTDLVDLDTLELAEEEVRERLAETALAGAGIVRVSAETGAGLDDLRVALDDLLAAAPVPADTRARLFVDRVFTIAGAGTVVTGTLGGGRLVVGDEVELYPRGRTARIRSLQTHGRGEDHADPVSRVAANLVGTAKEDLARGDVVGPPGRWRPTTVFEGSLRPVRGLGHAITGRGAFKVYAGATEADARVRVYGSRAEPGHTSFVRITTSRPLLLDVFDRYVLRESGRQETIGGGSVLDPAPPRRAAPAPEARLARRAAATRDELPAILADERGAIRASDVALLTGSEAAHPDVGEWILRDGLLDASTRALIAAVGEHHEGKPLDEGLPLASARRALGDALRPVVRAPDRALIDAILDHAGAGGLVVPTGDAVALPAAARRPVDRAADPLVRAVVDAISAAPAQPPTVRELVTRGIGRDAIDAAGRAGLVVRVAPDLIFTPELIDRARAIVSGAGDAGITVSTFREALGTSRKFALPILEWFDQRGITRRDGDLRIPRS
ncbi:MAG TPA: selenocysteine-specific translation elongation factor [Actinomycetota bacterium]|nr:selenocysteine-specific translation elongation factor [Actinomycetota bacterium]